MSRTFPKCVSKWFQPTFCMYLKIRFETQNNFNRISRFEPSFCTGIKYQSWTPEFGGLKTRINMFWISNRISRYMQKVGLTHFKTSELYGRIACVHESTKLWLLWRIFSRFLNQKCKFYVHHVFRLDTWSPHLCQRQQENDECRKLYSWPEPMLGLIVFDAANAHICKLYVILATWSCQFVQKLPEAHQK